MKEQFSSNSKKEIKDKNSEPKPNNNKQLLNKIINTTRSDNLENCEYTDIIKLYNLYIESEYTKTIRYKKMILTTCKLQEIHINLWGLYNISLLLRKTYIDLVLDEFTYKS